MIAVNVEPNRVTETWIGPAYGASGFEGLKLLVLAEVEPSDEGHVSRIGRTFHADLTPSYIDGTMKHLLWTEVARLVLGTPAPRDACEKFWQSVAFSNLIVPTGGASRKTTTNDDWDRARVLLPALLHELRPDALLVLGERMWSETLLRSPTVAVEGSTQVRRWIDADGFSLVAAHTPHPAADGFAFRDYVSRVRALVDAAEPWKSL